MNNLKGELCICGLEEVTNREESRKANLSIKSKLQCLKFHWKVLDYDKDVLEDEKYNEEDVLEGLEPHTNLKELEIQFFKGKKFASWMLVESQSIVVLQNLVKIKLEGCNRCEQIPSLGHLPNLKVIEINNMPNVKCIGKGFYGFTVLLIMVLLVVVIAELGQQKIQQ